METALRERKEMSEPAIESAHADLHLADVQEFRMLNYLAVLKALKKHDKALPLSDPHARSEALAILEHSPLAEQRKSLCKVEEASEEAKAVEAGADELGGAAMPTQIAP